MTYDEAREVLRANQFDWMGSLKMIVEGNVTTGIEVYVPPILKHEKKKVIQDLLPGMVVRTQKDYVWITKD